MSRENVEVVRAIYSAFARRDRDAAVGDLDPSIRVYDRPSHPEASVYEGREGFLRFNEADSEAFEEVVYEPQDFLDNGAYVVVPIKQSGRGKSSALRIEEDIVNVWKLRRGKCVELRIFSTLEEALQATRPSEELVVALPPSVCGRARPHAAGAPAIASGGPRAGAGRRGAPAVIWPPAAGAARGPAASPRASPRRARPGSRGPPR
jgi:ketosteroid isomerase-like protein